jgi:hypothetical protein
VTSGTGFALTTAITLALLVWGCIGGNVGEARERLFLRVERWFGRRDHRRAAAWLSQPMMYSGPLLDEDGRPLPARPTQDAEMRYLSRGEQRVMARALRRSTRPWEPPGPPPRRKLTWRHPMVLVVAAAVAAFLAVSILIFMGWW